MPRPRVLVVVGTRPDAIKMLPVHRRLRMDGRVRVGLLSTGQHDGVLREVLRMYPDLPDYDLELMRAGQTLARLLSRTVRQVAAVLERDEPDLVLVQGDTATALGAGLAAASLRIPIGHVEAGLRTGCRLEPFPEELNRRQLAVLAELHFAPTAAAVQNLIREGVPAERVFLTGNTVVDALRDAEALRAVAPTAARDLLPVEGRLLVATVHRRENWDRPIEEICAALGGIVDEHPDVHVLFPVHPNPRVSGPVTTRLSRRDRIQLVPPLPYLDFLNCLARADLVLTDSGGVQEEAPSFGVPVLVLRRATERPEGVARGLARVVGIECGGIVRAAREALAAPRPAPSVNPYGDGNAAGRIATHVYHQLGVLERPQLQETA